MTDPSFVNFQLLNTLITKKDDPSSQKVIKFFIDKKALSKNKSISLSKNDFQSLGWKNLNFEICKLYTFLEKDSQNKYWLNESKLQNYYLQSKKINNNLLITILTLFIFITMLIMIF